MQSNDPMAVCRDLQHRHLMYDVLPLVHCSTSLANELGCVFYATFLVGALPDSRKLPPESKHTNTVFSLIIWNFKTTRQNRTNNLSVYSPILYDQCVSFIAVLSNSAATGCARGWRLYVPQSSRARCGDKRMTLYYTVWSFKSNAPPPSLPLTHTVTTLSIFNALLTVHRDISLQ